MLRDYQLVALRAIWANLDRHVVASLPTGSGKSHIIAELCRKALQEYPGTRILVIAHVKELLEQNTHKILLHWPEAPVGIYCAGLRSRQLNSITVASIQSIYRQLQMLDPYDIIIVDEAHRIPHGESGMYHALLRQQSEAKVVGLTATPYRLGGGLIHKGEDALFDVLACEVKTADLVTQGFLSPIRSRRGSEEADLDGVHTRGGEFVPDEMAAAFDEDGLTKAVVADILKHAAGRSSIMVFCCSVAHCHNVAYALRCAGELATSVITGETPSADRSEIIANFKARRCRILVNCDVLTTGFDAPNIDCIVLLRATKSPGLYVQIIGRGLRKTEGKEDCLLLDYGGNIVRHGPIDSVTAERVEKDEEPPRLKTCPQCGDLIPIQSAICPACGYEYSPHVSEPRKLSHGLEASTADPLAPTIVRLRVLDVRYSRHTKPGKPDSMRVSYTVAPEESATSLQLAMNVRQVSEWICFEHRGYPRERAMMWASRRGVSPAPRTVSDALECIFTEPAVLTVRLGGRYPEILHHEFSTPKRVAV